MNPSVEDRLNSVVRALTGVILPALPAEAGLAREQAMLAAGHLQIIVAQLGATPAFERAEAADLSTLADAVLAVAAGGPATAAATTALRDRSQATDEAAADQTRSLQDGIDALLVALRTDGDAAARAQIDAIVLDKGAMRAEQDRRWFAAMGFDIDYS